ncbi:hypothetical protein [Thermosediminibacter oceani]|uniref:Uncharacterized protein n=1 Tax=Thermosediminibacter oceani (strain ATCC BAA-1034 / DSM 16646 / JW/IW-1228P) TaxID=555079 RepID=D9S1V2_THEOJ|nr:hypothetical protein [Thermosediminibacter oceani]ADL07379.1 hypothetical protein Toce_0606 [Thermosediminibacter oceani DSM 16646]
MERFAERFLPFLALLYLAILLLVLIIGRSYFNVLVTPEHEYERFSFLLNLEYKDFLLMAGGILAVITILLGFFISEFNVLCGVVMLVVLFMINFLVLYFLPVYYFPGGDMHAVGIAVLLYWPLYLVGEGIIIIKSLVKSLVVWYYKSRS